MKIHRKAVLVECEDPASAGVDQQPDVTPDEQPEVGPREQKRRRATPLVRCQQMAQGTAETGSEATCPMASMAEGLAQKATYALWLMLPGVALIGGGVAMLLRPEVLLWLMAGTSIVLGVIIVGLAAVISRLAAQLAEA